MVLVAYLGHDEVFHPVGMSGFIFFSKSVYGRGLLIFQFEEDHKKIGGTAIVHSTNVFCVFCGEDPVRVGNEGVSAPTTHYLPYKMVASATTIHTINTIG